MFSMAFDKALEITFDLEGGFTVDNGGPTNFGITQRTYDSWRTKKGLAKQSVTQVTKAEARLIYHEDYWTVAKCDSLPELLAIAHFDWAVNHGPTGAVRTLQRAVGATADGIFGPKTLAAVRAKGEKAALIEYMNQRDKWYDENQARVAPEAYNGWRRRVHKLWGHLLYGYSPVAV